MPLLQANEHKQNYIDLLKVVWSLSNLFSDNPIPYLYYRVAENIFCRSFRADNLSRSDCSADARLNRIWYWLKTFQHKNGNTLEKVAEFNKERELYIPYESDPKELVKKVSELRNRRIESTMSIHGIDRMVYHCISRDKWLFNIHEEEMTYVDINHIREVNKKNNAITFNDRQHEYSFNLSKSTLFKRFIINPIEQFEVNIFEDPFVLLEQLFKDNQNLFESESSYDEIIYLPLYSYKKERWIYVAERSWLNQRNAKARAEGSPRNPNEAYIAIPARIHHRFPTFFPTTNSPFDLYLPDWQKLSSKVCQQNNKALMSNPNRALWEWLLRDVLKKQEGEIVTYPDLQKMWVDTVEVAKKWNNYYINFKEVWTFEEFQNNYKK